MSDAVEAMMRSLKRNGTEYSDAMIKGPEMLAIGRLVLDPYSSPLYSSSPHMLASIDRKVAGAITMAEALEAVSFPGRANGRGGPAGHAEAGEEGRWVGQGEE